MAFPETDPTRPQSSESNLPESNASNPPARPSWETARPAAPPRRPAPIRPPAPAAEPTPYYRSAAPPAPAAPAAPVHAPSPVHQPAPMEMDVQYDLAGNPIASSAPSPAAAPYAPPTPFGYSAGNAAATWPPPPSAASPYGGWQNTAGNGTDKVAKLRWNWGAFLIPFWWSIFNGQRGLASVITLANVASRWLPAPFDWAGTVVSLGVSIYLGCMGHRLAWSSERFAGDYDNFIRTQRAWMIWGFALLGLGIGILVFFAMLIPGFTAALTGGHAHTPPHYRSYSSPAGSGYSGSNGDGSSGPASNN